MTTNQESKTNYDPTLTNHKMSALREEMLDVQMEQLVVCIRNFFDEGDACEPVCYLNDLMKNSFSNAEGLRIASFLMQLQRFDKCIGLLRKF